MKVCIAGCGAIGGLLAARLATTGAELTVLDRGVRLAALRERGLRLQDARQGTVAVSGLEVTETLAGRGPFDVVFLAVKAHEISAMAATLTAAVGASTTLVTLQNGIPWWYFQRHGGPLEGTVLESTDPGGQLAALIDPARIIGCVAYPAAEVPEPGVVRHIEGSRFPLGELDGSDSRRARQLAALLEAAGLKSPVLDDIRGELWLKAWGNLAFNPISALTHGTMAEIARHPHTRAYTVELMTEAAQVAEGLGIRFRVPLEKRLAGAERVGGHRTSMLQDVLDGRPLELDAILGAVIEMATLVGVEAPNLRALYALVSLRNATRLAAADNPNGRMECNAA